MEDAPRLSSKVLLSENPEREAEADVVRFRGGIWDALIIWAPIMVCVVAPTPLWYPALTLIGPYPTEILSFVESCRPPRVGAGTA